MDADGSKTKVIVLMGGPDAERPVSLASGRAVAKALRGLNTFDVIEQVIDTPSAEELASFDADVVFPVLHGRWGEGGPLQKLLEQIGVPFVGSGSKASALAMDKIATKTVLATDHVPTPPSRELRPGDPCDLAPPVVLKPVDDGSSVDIRICHTEDDVKNARAELEPRRPRLMAERYIEGRELTVGIALDQVLPILEVCPAESFYDYDAKYGRDDTNYIVNPDLPEKIAMQCRDLAQLAFERLGCRDIARVDFRYDGAQLWFLEINTMPGFTAHSLVPMASAEVGIPMHELCRRLVERALQRTRITMSS